MSIKLSSLNLGPLFFGGSSRRVSKEIAVRHLTSQDLAKLRKFCRVCNKRLGTNLKLSTRGLLNAVYAVGLSSDDKNIQEEFLSVHKGLKERMEHVNRSSKDNGIIYTLPSARDGKKHGGGSRSAAGQG